MPYSDSYANQILNYTLAKTQQLTAPTQVWIGLSSNNPKAAGGAFNELSGGGYARVLISLRNETYPNFISSATDRAITNAYQIAFPKATLAWLVNGIGLFSSQTGGEPFFYGAIELTEEQAEAGGLIVDPGAVALFDPQTFKIGFPATDISTAAATVSE